MGGVGARGRPEAAQQQKQPQASPMRMSLPLTSHGPQIFLSLRAAAALLFSLLSQHGVDPGRVAMARHFHRSTCMSDHHCDHGFGLIDRPRACLPAAASSTLERGCHAQTPVYHHLPLGAAWASSVLPAFVVLLVLGDTIFHLLATWLFFILSLISLQVTSPGHKRASASQFIPTATFFFTPSQLGFVRLDLYHT